MTKEHFISCEKLEKSVTNRKKGSGGENVNWLKLKVIESRKSEPFKIFVKSDLKQDTYVEINIKKKGNKTKSPGGSVTSRKFYSDNLNELWPQGKPISKEKLQDLKSMYHLIPKDCLSFYKNLKSADLEDDVDGFSGELDFEVQLEDE